MKPALLLAIAVLLSVSLSYAVVRICPATRAQAEAPPAATADDVARLTKILADSEERERALERRDARS